MIVELNLSYVHTDRIGYGRMGVYLAQELQGMGIKVYDDLLTPYEDQRPPKKDTDGRNTGRSRVAAWASAPSHAMGWWKDQIPVMYTMYEATELPASFTENLHEFDTLIVPSHQNVELFGKYHPNVHLVPLGVDPATWKYTPRRVGNDFNFLIGGSGIRKGVDLAISAFLEVFGSDEAIRPDMPIPRLILKSPRGNHRDPCITEKANHPRISVVPGYMEPEDEVALYETAHCYLQPSRGEGFGLQPLQAIAQGIPTILTAAHGHDSFAHLGYGLQTKQEKAAYFMFGESGDWWEPNFRDLCWFMQHVYDEYGMASRFAKRSAKRVADGFTWRHTAEKFVAAIGPERFLPYTGSDEWYKPTLKLYEVMVNRDRVIDVGGARRMYTAGKVYYEPADVKRVLFDSGCLDPACLKGEDVGLHPDQLGAVEEYSAAHSYCTTCGQRMNTAPTRADDVFAEAAGVTL